MRYLLMQVDGGAEFPRKRGVIALKERAGAISELLFHPDVWRVSLSASGKNFDGELETDTRERPWPTHLLCHGSQRLDTEAPARGDSWVTAMLELAEAIRVRHGIITVMPPAYIRSSRSSEYRETE